MKTLTNDQGLTSVTGFNVFDTVLITHLIEKLLRGGGVTGKELSFVAALRTKAVAAAERAVGYDIEQLVHPPAASTKKTKIKATNVVQGG